MSHTNAIKPSPARWEYIKLLKPHPGRVLYTGGTYNVGRNAAKRAKRAAHRAWLR